MECPTDEHCLYCGAELTGTPLRCESLTLPENLAPDCGPIYCDGEEQDSNQRD